MKLNCRNVLMALILLVICPFNNSHAQQAESVYGDAVKAEVKMNYVYTMEEAFKKARKLNKPIFFNCFADWAMPCHLMNKAVFSDREFCDYMDKHFVNLFIDVTQGENTDIAKKYDIQYFAHFLILDSDGNVLLRIVGGREKEDMKAAVSLALNPKTTLPGAEQIYQSGKRGKKETRNYLTVLNLANENKKFMEINKEYIRMLKPKEYLRKENWVTFSSTISNKESENFNYLIAHKEKFVKANGAKKVNSLIESLYYWDIMNYAMGKTPYDKMKVIELNNEIQKAGLSDTCNVCRVYPIIHLRGERKYDKMLDYLTKNASQLGVSKLYIDTSLELPDMSDETRGKIINYLNACIEAQKDDSGVVKQLKAFIYKLEHPNGIIFEKGNLAEAMAKAKKEDKLLFVDCYTIWCGPCKRMSNQVFVQEAVGAVYNKQFINVKLDMEQKDGIELNKKHPVTSYPTLLFMDGDGNIVKKIIGAQNADNLLKIASEVIKQ